VSDQQTPDLEELLAQREKLDREIQEKLKQQRQRKENADAPGKEKGTGSSDSSTTESSESADQSTGTEDPSIAAPPPKPEIDQETERVIMTVVKFAGCCLVLLVAVGIFRDGYSFEKACTDLAMPAILGFLAIGGLGYLWEAGRHKMKQFGRTSDETDPKTIRRGMREHPHAIIAESFPNAWEGVHKALNQVRLPKAKWTEVYRNKFADSGQIVVEMAFDADFGQFEAKQNVRLTISFLPAESGCAVILDYEKIYQGLKSEFMDQIIDQTTNSITLFVNQQLFVDI
jgi:hypothetical protein